MSETLQKVQSKQEILALEEAVGHPLAHDLTQVIPATHYKGPRFKKGYVVKEEDLETLRSMGREHLAILHLDEGEVHEDDAALRLAAGLTGVGVDCEGPGEGKCSLRAEHRGLLAFDAEMVHAINADSEWIVATLPPHIPVEQGEVVASFRIRPLWTTEEHVAAAEALAEPIGVQPFLPLKTGLVTTGRELAEGRVEDAFRPRLERKLDYYGGRLLGREIVTDDEAAVADAIRGFVATGAELVVCTGGMSVDVNDRTPGAIRSVCSDIAFQGVPSLPGSMLMLGTAGQTAVVGAPACVVHDERTTLDLLLDQLFAGRRPNEADVRRWGVGGLCRRCSACIYPACSFAARS